MSRARRVLAMSQIHRGQWVPVQKRQMTAGTKGKPTCASQSATNFPEPNAIREELEAAAVRLNLLAEAEIYSTDAVMTMVGN
jgi:hypothetical protein